MCEALCLCAISVTDIQFKIVDVFVYEIGQEEKDLLKHEKIDDLTLKPVEWAQVKLFNNLLAIHLGNYFIVWCH